MGQYIFRMKQFSAGVSCALFEADGGAWTLDAKNAIREYLEGELDCVPGLVILS